MANSYFQFKHFRIEQGSCAMKVCTDACVLGAAADLTGTARLLDIGTGTGLLALMAAQRNPAAIIEAVELDPAAAAQAAANAAASPWADRIRIQAQSLAHYAATHPAPFDHILCNPPFFRHSLLSPDAARTTARHTSPDTLSFAELADFAARFLAPSGQLTVLLPPPEMLHFERKAALAGLFLHSQLVVRHRPGSKILRHISSFGHQPQPRQVQELAIHEAASEAYSAEFRALLQDFYLAF
ncbi:tRNA1Val (adenine37-N6)-methyltransferase [Hymenobacter daecheongensis DSM 21074]|uniref:tRNA1(Val) (adenine(37)-N6)-methyltransferase n=1 Tax=Hymenobacter daecheongensis DSM 21074 TaxID=1121955 RepID=A0A1M6E4W4_9BACT|nr:methyltransferase [Hymenobacter daecheongensis]SHI80453.1 tRNA1Val (adenine37-N6)-methyltransferase [Hymenobacter daecheongensis DSM 21074]